jgi:hypothetical protein
MKFLQGHTLLSTSTKSNPFYNVWLENLELHVIISQAHIMRFDAEEILEFVFIYT